MHITTAQHLPTLAQPVPLQCLASPGQYSPLHIYTKQGIPWSGICLWPGSGQLSWLCLSFFCPSSLAEQEKPNTPWLRVSTTKQQLKHECIINIALILNQKPPAKINKLELLIETSSLLYSEIQMKYWKKKKVVNHSEFYNTVIITTSLKAVNVNSPPQIYSTYWYGLLTKAASEDKGRKLSLT